MADGKANTMQADRPPGYAPVAALQQHYDQLDVMSPSEYAAKEKKLLRKIDLRLMPLLFLMIVLKFVPYSRPVSRAALTNKPPQLSRP
jgi:hypothetical protein